MNTRLILSLLCSLGLALHAQSPVQTWTSADGRTLQAAFKELTGDTVTLILNGTATPVPLTRLSPESQAQARALAQKAPAAANPQAQSRLEIVPRFGKKAPLTPRALGTLPEALASAANVIDLSVHEHHGIALLSDGTAIPWGYEFSNLTPAPAEMLGAGKKLRQVIAKGGEDWFLYEDGTVDAWEAPFNRKLRIEAATASLQGMKVVKISASGRINALALTDAGRLVYLGQEPVFKLPPAVESATITDMAAGTDVSLAITVEGRVHVWGKDNNGCRDLPKALAALLDAGKDKALHVATEGDTCAAVLGSGRVFFWGNGTKDWNSLDDRIPGAGRIVSFCYHSYDGAAMAVQDKQGKWRLYGRKPAFSDDLQRTIGTAPALGGGFEAIAVLRVKEDR